MSVKKYRVYCNDEATTVTGWLQTEPTTCFNNNTHTIDTDQTTMLDVQAPASISLNQVPSVEDQSSYYLHHMDFTVDAKETVNVPIVLDVDSNMFAVYIDTRKENIGDVWSTYINKDTPIGVVAESVTDSTEIKMAEASVAYAKPGYYISFDGIEYVRIIGRTTDTITLKSAVTVNAGTPVLLTYYMVYNKKIIVHGEMVMGNTIIGSFKVPKEYTAGIRYTNNTNSRKTVALDVETTF